jgi:hypothetical protein
MAMASLTQQIKALRAEIEALYQASHPSAGIDEDHWASWLTTLFRPYFVDDVTGILIPFGPHHEQFWDWVWALRPGVRPRPFVAIWPRGGGKSTSAEMACVAVGARQTRRYGLYICATQAQADDHVQNVATMLESADVAAHYPALANRMVGKYGASRGWRRNRLRTSDGFTIDAVGLDTAMRGAKIDAHRPDFLILDDLDQDTDSALVVAKKLRAFTRKILPTGADDVAVLGVQNLIHPDGIFAQMAEGRADFLSTRILSGPIPALRGLAYEVHEAHTVLTAGEPTWAGQDMAQCQALLDDITLEAFLAECQHVRMAGEGAIFGDVWQDGMHIMEPFAIPRHWVVRRAFDWGLARRSP